MAMRQEILGELLEAQNKVLEGLRKIDLALTSSGTDSGSTSKVMVSEEVASLKSQLQDAALELQAWQTGQQHATLTPEYLQHQRECPHCKPGLEEYDKGVVQEHRQEVIDALTPEEALALAKKQGWWPPPPIEVTGLSPKRERR